MPWVCTFTGAFEDTSVCSALRWLASLTHSLHERIEQRAVARKEAGSSPFTFQPSDVQAAAAGGTRVYVCMCVCVYVCMCVCVCACACVLTMQGHAVYVWVRLGHDLAKTCRVRGLPSLGEPLSRCGRRSYTEWAIIYFKLSTQHMIDMSELEYVGNNGEEGNTNKVSHYCNLNA